MAVEDGAKSRELSVFETGPPERVEGLREHLARLGAFSRKALFDEPDHLAEAGESAGELGGEGVTQDAEALGSLGRARRCVGQIERLRESSEELRPVAQCIEHASDGEGLEGDMGMEIPVGEHREGRDQLVSPGIEGHHECVDHRIADFTKGVVGSIVERLKGAGPILGIRRARPRRHQSDPDEVGALVLEKSIGERATGSSFAGQSFADGPGQIDVGSRTGVAGSALYPLEENVGRSTTNGFEESALDALALERGAASGSTRRVPIRSQRSRLPRARGPVRTPERWR